MVKKRRTELPGSRESSESYEPGGSSGRVAPQRPPPTLICARCTRSVSIVHPAYYAHPAAFRARFYMEPEASDSGSMMSGAHGSGAPVHPAYYAHSAAFRARFYMEPEASDSGSMMSGAHGSGAPGGGGGPSSSTRVPVSGSVRPLPALKENVKKVVFYC